MGITTTQYRIVIGTFCGKDRFKVCDISPDIYFTYCGMEFPNMFTNLNVHTNAYYYKHLYKFCRSNWYYNTNSMIRSVIGLSIILHVNLLLLCSGDVHPNPGPPTHLTDIKICHSNVRSIRNATEKLDYIKCTLADQFDVITLSETWLNSTIDSKNLSIPGFQNVFRRDRSDNFLFGLHLTLQINAVWNLNYLRLKDFG